MSTAAGAHALPSAFSSQALPPPSSLPEQLAGADKSSVDVHPLPHGVEVASLIQHSPAPSSAASGRQSDRHIASHESDPQVSSLHLPQPAGAVIAFSAATELNRKCEFSLFPRSTATHSGKESHICWSS